MRSSRQTMLAAIVAAACVALTAPAAHAAAQEAPTQAPPAQETPAAPVAEPVADRYIVVLADTATGPGATVNTVAQTLAGRYDTTVELVYRTALRGFATTADAEQAAKLAADPAVAYVEPVQVARAAQQTQPNPPSYGLDRVDQRSLPLNGAYTYDNGGDGVSVYVVDSGLRLSHRDFGGRARGGPDYVAGGTVRGDCNGHGTHVAGTVGGNLYGVAKRVDLIGVRVLGCNGTGTSDATLAAIDWVTRNAVRPAVANFSISFGSSAPSVESAIRNSISSGVVWALSANNENRDACNSSPARLPEAITVGNSTRTDARSGSSNFGRCLDIWAPGTDIVSASHQSDTGSRTMTGTSMAAPHVAGAAALQLVRQPGATPQQVRDALVASASTVTISGAGSGSPNRLLYTR